MPPPFWTDGNATIYCGDSLDLLRRMPTGSVDAVITDPPYSSGGLMRSDRNLKTSDKYVLSGTMIERPEFFGDNRDQRSFTLWCGMWMAECLRVVRPGGYLFTFTDWRQLPCMSDAVQVGGWVWRGIVPWNKGPSTRPVRGWFRSQCEYVLVCASGAMGNEQKREVDVCAPGFYSQAVNSAEKHHITGKPVKLMEFLMAVLPKGSRVLDPFAGGFTTCLAAKNLNFETIGMEMSPALCRVGVQRLSPQLLGLDFEVVPNDGTIYSDHDEREELPNSGEPGDQVR